MEQSYLMCPGNYSEVWTGPTCQDVHCPEGACNESTSAGTCEYTGTIGDCNCATNWSGDSCETFTCSIDVDCLNGGSCVDGSCECVAPYSGPTCATEDNCRETQCSNHGTCINEGGCDCDPGWGDIDCSIDRCSQEFYSCSSDSNQG